MSERLTLANSYGEDGRSCEDCEYFGEPSGCNREDGACDAYTNHQDLYQRLFDIESILYDADGNEVISLARLRELAEAERETETVPLTEEDKPRYIEPILNVHPRLKTEFWTPHECGYCGEHLADEWVFCPECGTATVPDYATEPKGEPHD